MQRLITTSSGISYYECSSVDRSFVFSYYLLKSQGTSKKNRQEKNVWVWIQREVVWNVPLDRAPPRSSVPCTLPVWDEARDPTIPAMRKGLCGLHHSLRSNLIVSWLLYKEGANLSLVLWLLACCSCPSRWLHNIYTRSAQSGLSEVLRIHFKKDSQSTGIQAEEYQGMWEVGSGREIRCSF